MLVTLALSLCLIEIGNASATTSWVPIVKDGKTLTASQRGVADLAGVSSVSFAFIRGRVKALTDPTTVDLRPDYGAAGTRIELSTFPDDYLPISRNDYAWQDLSPMYLNPTMDYYWGYQMYDLCGQSWYEHIPSKYDEWGPLGNSKLSFDNDQTMLDQWANGKV